jgi:maltose-binding protein MalE
LTTKITIAQPPRITDIKKAPDLDYYPEWSEVKISATVSDEGSGVKNATLYYRTNRDSAFTAVPMEYNFLQQVYEATLPGQPAGTTVEFYILAYDRAGNIAVENNSGIYYNYQVVPEFPSSTILLLMLITCLTIAILLKRKHQTLRNSKVFF